MWNPNILIMFSYINMVATSFVQDATRSTSTHLVIYSTVVIMYLAHVLYLGFGKGPTKSISHISSVKQGLMEIRGISFYFRGLPILWH